MDEKVKQADFLEMSVTALSSRVSDLFEMSCSFIMGEYDRRAESKKEGEIEYPFANIKFTNTTEREDGYNKTAVDRHGIKTRLHDSGQYWIKFHGTQINCDLSLRFVCDDQREVFKIIKNFYRKRHRFSFRLISEDDSFSISHNVGTEKSLAIPPLEETEYGNTYTIETPLILSTWIGDLYKIPTIISVETGIYPLTKDKIDSLMETDPDFIGDKAEIIRFNAAVNPILPVEKES